MTDQRTDQVLRALSPGEHIGVLWPADDRQRTLQQLMLTVAGGEPPRSASPAAGASVDEAADRWTVVEAEPARQRRPRRHTAAVLLAACLIVVAALCWTLSTSLRVRGNTAPAGRSGTTAAVTPTPSSTYPAVPVAPDQGTSAFEKGVFADGVITYDEFIAAAHLYADCMTAHGSATSVDTTSIPGNVQYLVDGSTLNIAAAEDACSPGTNGLIEPEYGAGIGR